MIVLYKFSPDSDSEIILKIGYYLVQLRRTKMVPIFRATLYMQTVAQVERKTSASGPVSGLSSSKLIVNYIYDYAQMSNIFLRLPQTGEDGYH